MGRANDIALGEFLRSRRNRVDPEHVAIASYGRRRVPGLRREEVAFLAGVSASYYTRIEQGTAGMVSGSVLDAVAAALRLDDEERAQLYRLAQVLPQPAAASCPQQLAPSAEVVVRNLDTVPAGVLGRSMRVLAWNRLAHLVFAPQRGFEEPWTEPGLNWLRVVFLDEFCHDLFVDWPAVAEDLVGRLRAMAARHSGDPETDAVVDELREASPAFRELWLGHPTRERPLGEVELDHPVLGRLVLRDAVLHPAEDPDQSLLVFSCAPGSATERALREA